MLACKHCVSLELRPWREHGKRAIGTWEEGLEAAESSEWNQRVEGRTRTWSVSMPHSSWDQLALSNLLSLNNPPSKSSGFVRWTEVEYLQGRGIFFFLCYSPGLSGWSSVNWTNKRQINNRTANRFICMCFTLTHGRIQRWVSQKVGRIWAYIAS